MVFQTFSKIKENICRNGSFSGNEICWIFDTLVFVTFRIVLSERLEEMKVCPALKTGWKDDIENYRPILILSNFTKVFERALYDIIYTYVKCRINDSRHGFIRGRYIVTILACFTPLTALNLFSRCYIYRLLQGVWQAGPWSNSAKVVFVWLDNEFHHFSWIVIVLFLQRKRTINSMFCNLVFCKVSFWIICFSCYSWIICIYFCSASFFYMLMIVSCFAVLFPFTIVGICRAT